MSIFKLFRKKPSRDDFISTWLTCHKEISVSMFHKFKKFSLYRDELDMLLALKEIEYLVFVNVLSTLTGFTYRGLTSSLVHVHAGVHQRIQQTIPAANKFTSGLAPDPQRVRFQRII